MEESLNLALIKISGGTQSRVGLDQSVVEEYEQSMRDGSIFPPLDVYYDGQDYWLSDGFHRYWAAGRVGIKEIRVSIHQGTRRDAILHSVGANAYHGLRRTNADKQRAVEVLLKDNEWMLWSDREIARRCGVGNKFVGDVRRSLCPEHSENGRSYTTKHGTTTTMQVKNIGRTTADIPSLDAELAKSKRQQHERGRGSFLAVAEQSEVEHGNGAIAADVEAMLATNDLFSEQIADMSEHDQKELLSELPELENSEDEEEIESYMPYTLYAASNCEEIDYLIDKLGAREVAKQFVESNPELKAEVRGYYPGIDAIARAEIGEHLNPTEAITPTPTAELNQPPQPTDYEREWLSAVGEIIRLKEELKQANELLGRTEERIVNLSEQLTQTREKLEECRESNRSTLVGCRVKVINESSKHSSRLGTALSATVD